MIVASACLASCAPGGQLPLLASDPPGTYHLGAGDELRIIVYGQQQLTGQFFVDASGDISVPLLGSLHASGLTRSELASQVADGLSQKGIILHPSVSIDVVQYRPIFVLGEVAHPGPYPYQPGLTMLSAVALAGGFTYRGVTERALVVRTEQGHAEQGRVVPDSFLQPGDVLKIYERFF